MHFNPRNGIWRYCSHEIRFVSEPLHLILKRLRGQFWTLYHPLWNLTLLRLILKRAPGPSLDSLPPTLEPHVVASDPQKGSGANFEVLCHLLWDLTLFQF